MTRSFELDPRLRYPFTVSKILKAPGATVAKNEPLLEFSFQVVNQVLDPVLHEVREHVQRGYGVWESPAEGTVREWRLEEGAVVRRNQTAVVIEESCDHAVQYQGMCGKCGKDMTEVSWVTDVRDTQRATINMVHDQTRLLVSDAVARSADADTKLRLLEQRKMILVVDLDQTVIHACTDPTVAAWKADPDNPNHDAVRDVHEFKLDEGGGGFGPGAARSVANGCSYFIKLRPGCREFLAEIATLYELHVYTMATRAYAKHIAKIIDPDGKLFGNRIISRDENLMHSKNLQRLFPVSTNMVVIIDDRSDMWPNDRDNLIKVNPYVFFTGTGDVNSSFLPARQDLPPDEQAMAMATATATEDDVMEEQAKAVEKQIKERPLQHLQEELDRAAERGRVKERQEEDSAVDDGTELKDKEEEEEEEEDGQKDENNKTKEDQTDEDQTDKDHTDENKKAGENQKDKDSKAEEDLKNKDGQLNGTKPQSGPQPRPRLLQDNDDELSYLKVHLKRLHQCYFKRFDAYCKRARHKLPKDQRDKTRGAIDISLAPDVGKVLNGLKRIVLEGAILVFSGLVPLGVDASQSDIGIRAISFGAQVRAHVDHNATHLVVSTYRPRTEKVQQASRLPYVQIVNQHWLFDSMSQWRWMDESKYAIHIDPADRRRLSAVDAKDDKKVLETATGDGGDDEAVAEEMGVDDGDGEVVGDNDGDDGDDDDEEPLGPLSKFTQADWDAVHEELKEILSDEDEEDFDPDAEIYMGSSTSEDEKDDGDGGDDNKKWDGNNENGDDNDGKRDALRGTKRKANADADGDATGTGGRRTPTLEHASKRRVALIRGGRSRTATPTPTPTPSTPVPASAPVPAEATEAEGQSNEQDETDELEAALLAGFEAVERKEAAK